MTSAQGTVISCGPDQGYSLQYTCMGPSCLYLNGFPGTTCATDNTTVPATLTCSNGVVCPSSTNFTSTFNFNQPSENVVVSQTQVIDLSDFCEEVTLNSDGTTGGTSGAYVDTGPCGPPSSNSSAPSNTTSTSTTSTIPSISVILPTNVGTNTTTSSINSTSSAPITSAGNFTFSSLSYVPSGSATITSNTVSAGSQTYSILSSATTSTSTPGKGGSLSKSIGAHSPTSSETSSPYHKYSWSLIGGPRATWGTDEAKTTSFTTHASESADQGNVSGQPTVKHPGATTAVSNLASSRSDAEWSAWSQAITSSVMPAESKSSPPGASITNSGTYSLTSIDDLPLSSWQVWSSTSTDSVLSDEPDTPSSSFQSTVESFWPTASSPEVSDPSTSVSAYSTPLPSVSNAPIATYTSGAHSSKKHNALASWFTFLLSLTLLVHSVSATADAFSENTVVTSLVRYKPIVAPAANVTDALAQRALTAGWKELADLFSEYLADKISTPKFADNLVAEVEDAICKHAAGVLVTKALGVDLVETCVTAIYTANALTAPEAEFLSVFGASILCNLLVSSALSGIGEIVDTICAEPKPCSEDLTTDNANCGTCGNVCASGETCVNGACTSSSCTGQTCSTFGPCGPGGSCVCASTAESTGFCVDGSTQCAGLASCGDSSNCASGEVCAVGTCCGVAVCVGATFCGGNGTTTTSAAASRLLKRSWSNATIDSVNVGWSGRSRY